MWVCYFISVSYCAGLDNFVVCICLMFVLVICWLVWISLLMLFRLCCVFGLRWVFVD